MTAKILSAKTQVSGVTGSVTSPIQVGARAAVTRSERGKPESVTATRDVTLARSAISRDSVTAVAGVKSFDDNEEAVEAVEIVEVVEAVLLLPAAAICAWSKQGSVLHNCC